LTWILPVLLGVGLAAAWAGRRAWILRGGFRDGDSSRGVWVRAVDRWRVVARPGVSEVELSASSRWRGPSVRSGGVSRVTGDDAFDGRFQVVLSEDGDIHRLHQGVREALCALEDAGGVRLELGELVLTVPLGSDLDGGVDAMAQVLVALESPVDLQSVVATDSSDVVATSALRQLLEDDPRAGRAAAMASGERQGVAWGAAWAEAVGDEEAAREVLPRLTDDEAHRMIVGFSVDVRLRLLASVVHEAPADTMEGATRWLSPSSDRSFHHHQGVAIRDLLGDLLQRVDLGAEGGLAVQRLWEASEPWLRNRDWTLARDAAPYLQRYALANAVRRVAQTEATEALPALTTILASHRLPDNVDIVKGAIRRLREAAGEQLGSLSLAEDPVDGGLSVADDEVSPTDPSSD